MGATVTMAFRMIGGLALWLGGASLVGASLLAPAALAQMVLPGAVTPTPEGSSAAAPSAKAPARAARPRAAGAADEPPTKRGTAVAAPSLTALVGRTLALNGGATQVTFGVAADRTVAVSRLTLKGHRISDTLADCSVEPPTVTPLPMVGLGKPNGLTRFRIEYAACPVSFDVLDGAVLVDKGQGACTFVEADCRAPVNGLWGTAPNDIGPDRVKALERGRAVAEAAVRSNYKALAASTKDRPAIMGFARDQAQFPSSREETCRDYAAEGRHGFCATKLTEARAASLFDRLGTALADKAARKAARQHRKGQ